MNHPLIFVNMSIFESQPTVIVEKLYLRDVISNICSQFDTWAIVYLSVIMLMNLGFAIWVRYNHRSLYSLFNNYPMEIFSFNFATLLFLILVMVL